MKLEINELKTISGKLPKQIFLLDLSWMMYRGWYAFKHLNVEIDGQEVRTGHIYFVVKVARSLLNAYPQSVLIFCIDSFPKKKHEIFSEYKAGRGERVIDVHREGLKISKLISFVPGCYAAIAKDEEADSVMASLSQKCDLPAVIYSGDDDMLQMLAYSNVTVFRELNGGRIVPLTSKHVQKKYGVNPVDLLLYRALRGDKSDNLLGYFRFPKRVAVFLAQKFRHPMDLIQSIPPKHIGVDKTLVKYWQMVKDDPSILVRNYKLMKLCHVSVNIAKSGDKTYFKDMCWKYQLKSLEGLYKWVKGVWDASVRS